MPSRVLFTDRANAGLDRLPTQIQLRVLARIARIQAAPRGPGALRLEEFNDVWRVRVGDYRVAYTLHKADDLIRIEQVGHRRDFYQNLGRLPHLH